MRLNLLVKQHHLWTPLFNHYRLFSTTKEEKKAKKKAKKKYIKRQRKLQVELLKMQNWVRSSGKKVLVIFEGRDAAHKTGTIKLIMQHLNPSNARVVALNVPSNFVKTQWYYQRYVQHLPGAGELVLFDRSWYNRAGVEIVMGFCTPQQHQLFLKQTPLLEEMLTESGVHIFKIWFSIKKDEQKKRLQERADSPLKSWKLSPIDEASVAKWDDYSEAKREMLSTTDTEHAPWAIIKSNDKQQARINVMRYILSSFEYDDKNRKVAVRPDPSVFSMARDVYSI